MLSSDPRPSPSAGGDVPPAWRYCKGCRFWSQWLPTTGDCMAYASKRQDAWLASDDMEAFAREWPPRPAADTQAHDTCDQWELQQ